MISQSETPLEEAALQEWVGRSKSVDDTLRAAQSNLMEATLSRETMLRDGDPLPALWHWIYFLEGSPTAKLGRDGHAAKGEFLPAVPLPRRMWAGGRLTYQRHPTLGEKMRRTSTIHKTALKKGSSGTLCFVTVLHEHFDANDALCFSEEQDIVYREDPAPNVPAPKPVPQPDGSAYEETVSPSSVLLFRYSALTFNSHRIHYDRAYCTDVEGYPGIIFHGPLTATLLADLAVRRNPDKMLKRFSFRATSPLFDTEDFTIHSDDQGTVWAATPAGGLAMKATAEFE
ncbi:MAG: MaoC family dehydratase N-terminal domain-containing protein [Pseudomonadota bacterium]